MWQWKQAHKRNFVKRRRRRRDGAGSRENASHHAAAAAVPLPGEQGSRSIESRQSVQWNVASDRPLFKGWVKITLRRASATCLPVVNRSIFISAGLFSHRAAEVEKMPGGLSLTSTTEHSETSSKAWQPSVTVFVQPVAKLSAIKAGDIFEL